MKIAKNTPTTYLVSRHAAAIDWIKEQVPVDKVIAHLDIDLIDPNDIIIGTLPIHVAAQVCARHARYIHLSIDVPPEWRGKELNRADFLQCWPRLESYFIQFEGLINEGKPL